MPCSNNYGALDHLVEGTPSYEARIKREAEQALKREQENRDANDERRHKELMEALKRNTNSEMQAALKKLQSESDAYAAAFCKITNYMYDNHKLELIRFLAENPDVMKVFTEHQEIDKKCNRNHIEL